MPLPTLPRRQVAVLLLELVLGPCPSPVGACTGAVPLSCWSLYWGRCPSPPCPGGGWRSSCWSLYWGRAPPHSAHYGCRVAVTVQCLLSELSRGRVSLSQPTQPMQLSGGGLCLYCTVPPVRALRSSSLSLYCYMIYIQCHFDRATAWLCSRILLPHS